MLTVFPFEADFYAKHEVPVTFVGHPLADEIALKTEQQLARKQLGLDPQGTFLAILPGSRAGELRHLAPVFLAAAKLCQQKMPGLRCIAPMVNAARRHEFSIIKQQIAPDLSCRVFDSASRAVMAAADVVLVASGTATLEAMLLKRPMVIAFRMGRWSFRWRFGR